MRKIGSVKRDIHRQETQFHRVTFSDTQCIKGLITHRSSVDPYYGLEPDDYYDHAGTIYPMNQELICLYIDLDNLISRCKLNVKQRFIINKLMLGYTTRDVAKMFKQTTHSIDKSFDVICEKIKKLNDLDWKYEYVYMSLVKVKWNYKKCTKCKEFKPMIKEFYGLDSRNRDGFNSICRSCGIYAKNS